MSIESSLVKVFAAWLVAMVMVHCAGQETSSSSSMMKNVPLKTPVPEHVSKNYPYYLAGKDKDGRSVIVFEAGRWDFRRAVEANESAILTTHFLHYIELVKAQAVADNSLEDRADGVTGIGDATGFGISQVASTAVNYAASTFLNIARPLLGPLSEKMDIYGSNPETWKPALLKNIPADQLPEWYGGKKNFKPVAVFG